MQGAFDPVAPCCGREWEGRGGWLAGKGGYEPLLFVLDLRLWLTFSFRRMDGISELHDGLRVATA
jgi:hypothetical protein